MTANERADKIRYLKLRQLGDTLPASAQNTRWGQNILRKRRRNLAALERRHPEFRQALEPYRSPS